MLETKINTAKYGEIREELEKKGNPIGAVDYFIAAHALSEELILVTNNVKEFKSIKGISIQPVS